MNVRILLLILFLSTFLLVSRSAADELEDLIQIYGSLRPEAIARHPEGGEGIRRMDDGYSRVGLKGTADLTGKLTGFYKYERRVSANDGQSDGAVRGDNNELRQVHVGLSGEFGSVSIGRHYGLYYDYIDDELDRHRSHYSDAIIYSDLFVSNAVVYRSPVDKGFSVGVLVELNDADGQGNSIDERVEFAGTFQQGGFSVHGGYVKSPAHDGLIGAAASYQFGTITATGVYQKFDRSATVENTLLSGALDVDVSPINRVRLSVTSNKEKNSPDLDEIYIIVGVDHRFSDQFLAFIEYFKKSTEVAQASDESAWVFGFRFDF